MVFDLYRDQSPVASELNFFVYRIGLSSIANGVLHQLKTDFVEWNW